MDETTTKTIEESTRISNEEEVSTPNEIQELQENSNLEVKSSPNGSEYQSIDSAGSSSEDEGLKMHSHHLENEQEELGSESEGSVILEREEGDGQESLPAKKVDDDEDKKNPQYIPKRGTFYEHDDRTLDDSSDKQETTEKTEKQSKKNVWMEKKERWGHDRYNDNEQAPKSRAELVAIYGYDIRNEDGPPRARRRRRYGRGPNKYTRTWEDEDAYKPTKPVKTPPKKPSRGRNNEEYPPLSNQSNRQNYDDDDDDEEEDHASNNMEEALKAQKFSPAPVENNISVFPNDLSKVRQETSNRKSSTSSDPPSNRVQQRVGTGRIVKPKPEIKKEIKDSDYTGFTKTRQFRNSKSEQKILPKNQNRDRRDVQAQYNNKQSSVQDVERDLNKLNIQDGQSKNSSKQSNQRQASVPPRLQAEQKASKRYSSLRQRSLPETAAPPFSQPNYYANDFNQQSQQAQPQQALLPQPIATTAQVPQIAPPPLPPLPQQVPVTATPILQAPPQFAAPFPQAPPAFLQPAVPPPPFIAQPAPQIINYVQGQPQFPPPPPPYPGYQHQQFNTVNQAAELYQGGTTYYSTQNQHLGQRLVPQKRPKAAIPIVPPPPQEPRGRGRNSNPRETPPVGDEICENINIENINNFEDAAVLVHQ